MKAARRLLAVLTTIFLTATLASAGDAMDLLKEKLREEIKKKVDEQLGTEEPAPDQQPTPEQPAPEPPKPGQLILAKPQMSSDPHIPLRVKTNLYPRVNGSTSAHPLGVVAAVALAGSDWLWATDSDGTRKLIPVRYTYHSARAGRPERRTHPLQPVATAPPISALKDEYIDKDFMQRSWHDGTHQGYTALIEGKADLILECRLPSTDELKLMADAKVDLVATPVALDAFVFLLNEKNPLPGLTAQQIRDIYAGKITDWSVLGKHAGKINPYVRNRNSGSQETMESLVMKGSPITGGRDMMTMTMSGPYNKLPRDENGIGFTFFYYDTYMSPIPGTKIAAVDGVAPNRKTIANGSYPFVTEVYLVHRKTLDPTSVAGKLARWFQTPAGKAAVMRSGYVPIGPEIRANR